MSHTPEPWHLPKGSTCMESNSGEVPRSEANARRIVAAVNACAGIETYAMELMTGELSLLNQVTHKLRERPTKKAVQYRKQRDKLLGHSSLTATKRLVDEDPIRLGDIVAGVI